MRERRKNNAIYETSRSKIQRDDKKVEHEEREREKERESLIEIVLVSHEYVFSVQKFALFAN